LVLASLLLSSIILKFLFNTDNLESLQALRVLLLTCLITIPSILMGYPFLAAMGHPRFTNFTVMVSAIFHVCGLTLLWATGWVSVVSVSVMVLLTELLLFVNRWLGIRKYGLLRKEGTDA
jgi:PST family polysaccharide transporter